MSKEYLKVNILTKSQIKNCNVVKLQKSSGPQKLIIKRVCHALLWEVVTKKLIT